MTDHLEKLFESYPTILSVKELADILSLNTKTVYDYLQNGELPAYHLGTKWVIIKDEVIAALRSHSNTEANH